MFLTLTVNTVLLTGEYMLLTLFKSGLIYVSDTIFIFLGRKRDNPMS